MRIRVVAVAVMIVFAGCGGILPDSVGDTPTKVLDSQTDDATAEDTPPTNQTGSASLGEIDTSSALPYVSNLPPSYNLQSEGEYNAEVHPETLTKEFNQFGISKYHYRTFLRNSSVDDSSIPLSLFTKITVHRDSAAASEYLENETTSQPITERTQIAQSQELLIQVYEQSNKRNVVRVSGTIGRVCVVVTGENRGSITREIVVERAENIVFRLSTERNSK